MRVISLNTWGGRALHPLMHFFRQRAKDVDVFCLQEIFDADQKALEERHPDEHVRGDIFKKILNELKDFEGSFAFFDDNPLRQSLAIFVRRTLPIKEIGDLIVYKPEHPIETGSSIISARKIQYVSIEVSGQPHHVVNFHGLWDGKLKNDSPERIDQSHNVNKFLATLDGHKILCGDFNLNPDTASLGILEQGMKNLVKEYKIKSTRTPLYRHYNDVDGSHFADYCLTSPDIVVKHFEVLPDIVSDHAPLYLEF